MQVLIDLAKGLLIGVGSVTPGVSGGTLALSMGEYEQLIGALASPSKWRRSVRNLWPLAVGIAVGIFGFAFGIEWLLVRFPLPTLLCFVGLVLGGVPVLWRHFLDALGNTATKPDVRIAALVFFVFLAFSTVLPFFTAADAHRLLGTSLNELASLFLVGLIASATLVIPGISGSMLLVVLGYYSGILSAATGLLRGVLAWQFDAVVSQLIPLLVFGLGILAGLILVAKMVRWLFAHFAAYAYAGVLGLIIASPVAMIAEGLGREAAVTAPRVLIGFVTLALGFALATQMDRPTPGEGLPPTGGPGGGV